ncbi:large conductance mechanosensitive channel protein MscL [Candidatus Saccharibacteria bacterium]|nr:large conductance mechanosensitive channel protein MscL [Candidatus Saccharibacteria bacterium]
MATEKNQPEKKENGFIKEFREFISQGSIMDLAIGVVIGTAFSAIVNSVVNDIVMPVIGLLLGGVDFTDLKITIPNFFGGNTAAVIAYGNFIQNVVNFVVIALSLFLVMKAMNTMNRKAKESAERLAKKAEAAKKSVAARKAKK